MKIDRNRLYTHPVLADGRDDYETCTFAAERKFSVDAGDNLVLDMKLSTTCAQIQTLVRTAKAKYLLHVECPSTLYRETFGRVVESFSCTIPLSRVKSNLYCVAFVVADTDIKNFSCDDWNADFDGLTFDLPKGSVLAYENLPTLSIDEDPNAFRNPASIFTVSKRAGDKLKPFAVDMNGDRINISLNESDYDLYCRYRADRNAQPLLNALTILPTLVYVFDELKLYGVESYGECKWFLALANNFTKRGVTNFADYLDEKTSLELAQEVMQSPLAKALKSLAFVYEAATPAEEDD